MALPFPPGALPQTLVDTKFLDSVTAFGRLKSLVLELIELVQAGSPSNQINQIAEQINLQFPAFETTYLVSNSQTCDVVRNLIDGAFMLAFTDTAVQTLLQACETLDRIILKEYADLVKMLFGGYITDRINNLVSFVTNQFRIFWIQVWDPKVQFTDKERSKLQDAMCYNCHMLEALTESEARLATRIRLGELKGLIQSFIPYLVIRQSARSSASDADFTGNVPLDLCCVDLVLATMFNQGLTKLDPTTLVVALLQIFREFVTRTSTADLSLPVSTVYYFDLDKFQFVFTSFGYQSTKAEINCFYIDAFVELFAQFYQRFQATDPTPIDDLNLDVILYEINFIFIFNASCCPVAMEVLEPYMTLMEDFIMKIVRIKGKDIYENFVLIDQWLLPANINREALVMHQYIQYLLANPSGGGPPRVLPQPIPTVDWSKVSLEDFSKPSSSKCTHCPHTKALTKTIPAVIGPDGFDWTTPIEEEDETKKTNLESPNLATFGKNFDWASPEKERASVTKSTSFVSQKIPSNFDWASPISQADEKNISVTKAATLARQPDTGDIDWAAPIVDNTKEQTPVRKAASPVADTAKQTFYIPRITTPGRRLAIDTRWSNKPIAKEQTSITKTESPVAKDNSDFDWSSPIGQSAEKNISASNEASPARLADTSDFDWASPIVDNVKQTPVPKVVSPLVQSAEKNISAFNVASPARRPDTSNFDWASPVVDDAKEQVSVPKIVSSVMETTDKNIPVTKVATQTPRADTADFDWASPIVDEVKQQTSITKVASLTAEKNISAPQVTSSVVRPASSGLYRYSPAGEAKGKPWENRTNSFQVTPSSPTVTISNDFDWASPVAKVDPKTTTSITKSTSPDRSKVDADFNWTTAPVEDDQVSPPAVAQIPVPPKFSNYDWSSPTAKTTENKTTISSAVTPTSQPNTSDFDWTTNPVVDDVKAQTSISKVASPSPSKASSELNWRRPAAKVAPKETSFIRRTSPDRSQIDTNYNWAAKPVEEDQVASPVTQISTPEVPRKITSPPVTPKVSSDFNWTSPPTVETVEKIVAPNLSNFDWSSPIAETAEKKMPISNAVAPARRQDTSNFDWAAPIVEDIIKETSVPKVASSFEETANKNISSSKVATPTDRPSNFDWTSPPVVDDDKPSAKSVISSPAQPKISSDIDWTATPSVDKGEESTSEASSVEPLETFKEESIENKKRELGQLTRVPTGTFWNKSRPAFARPFNYQPKSFKLPTNKFVCNDPLSPTRNGESSFITPPASTILSQENGRPTNFSPQRGTSPFRSDRRFNSPECRQRPQLQKPVGSITIISPECKESPTGDANDSDSIRTQTPDNMTPFEKAEILKQVLKMKQQMQQNMIASQEALNKLMLKLSP